MWMDALNVGLAVVLVILNGFFVAAEFALVKLTPARVAAMVREGSAFAGTTAWLHHRLDGSLSVCQLGITMASLGLGWVGEPAFAHVIEPLLSSVGVEKPAVLHAISFIVAFSTITAAHLVIGEQVPKIYAIRRSDVAARWCALPLKFFYFATYPFTVALSAVTNVLLRRVGIHGGGHDEAAHSEEELRLMLRQSRLEGEVTRSELQLIDAIFDFDEQICRKIMLPRTDLVFLDLGETVEANLDIVARTKHTRYPVCEGSLDRVRGVVHVKDLVGQNRVDVDLAAVARPPRYVPETLPIAKLLGMFQATRQHLLFVVDERDTITGVVTLENVLEEIIGPVQDEFDLETPDIVPEGTDRYLVAGSINLDVLCRKLGLRLESDDVDTLSGFMTDSVGRVPEVGDRVDLGDGIAEVLETKGARAVRVRVDLSPDGSAVDTDPEPAS